VTKTSCHSFTTGITQMIIFWFMTPCRFVGGHRHFGGTCRLHLQGISNSF